MGKPSAPTPPDPVATAAAQTTSNQQTAAYNQKLNMVDSTGPNGSVTYSPDANAPGGYAQTTTLSPAQQAIYDRSTAAQAGALGIANDQLGRVSGALGTSIDPHSYGSLATGAHSGPLAGAVSAPSLQAGFGQGQAVQAGYDPGGSVAGAFDPGQGVQGHVGAAGNIAAGYDQGGPIQRQVYGAGANPGAVQTAANAAYGQAASRLNPQWSQAAEQEQSRLAAQGLSQNSTAYQNDMQMFNNAKTDAYNQANFSAIAAGNQEQNTLYGQNLASGQFANQAQQQSNTQNAGAAAFQNAAQGQQYGQNLSSMQAANAAAAQQYAQNQGQASFANQAQAQRNSQAAAQAAFANQAAGQQYAQNLGAANFANAAAGSGFQDSLQAAQQQNAQQAQQYQQDYSNAQLGNQAQQQGFNQGVYAQMAPINELSALLGMGQVQSPTGINYTPASSANTDVAGITQNSFADRQAIYQQQMAQQNAMMGGLFGLGSAGIGKYSDARLKEGVRRVGQLDSGLPVYTFRYRGQPTVHMGVMAQEVEKVAPEAVHRDRHGWLMVDYGALA